jgi:hypothetical protein
MQDHANWASFVTNFGNAGERSSDPSIRHFSHPLSEELLFHCMRKDELNGKKPICINGVDSRSQVIFTMEYIRIIRIEQHVVQYLS